MNRMICAVALGLMTSLAYAQESAIANEIPAAESANNKAETVTAAAVAKDAKEEFKPPPGFRAKKLGGKVLYCNKDSTVGSRFKTEKCYNEDQMKAYLLARDENNRDMDQRRSICTSCAAQ